MHKVFKNKAQRCSTPLRCSWSVFYQFLTDFFHQFNNIFSKFTNPCITKTKDTASVMHQGIFIFWYKYAFWWYLDSFIVWLLHIKFEDVDSRGQVQGLQNGCNWDGPSGQLPSEFGEGPQNVKNKCQNGTWKCWHISTPDV